MTEEDHFGESGQNGEERIIAVMGLTGAGKSSFIKKATGSTTIRIGGSLQSETQEIHAYRTILDGRETIIVDTPGFDDTYRSDTEVFQQLASWLASTYASNKVLSGILYLHNIEMPRMAGSALRNLKIFTKMLGNDALPDVLLITTHWDALRDLQTGENREKKLIDEYWKPLIAKGARYARFDGRSASAREIVRSTLDRDTVFSPVPLNIQKEMVDQRLQLLKTAAGQSLNEDILRLQRSFANEMEALRREMSQALKAKDDEALKFLTEEQVKLEDKLEKAERERKSMQSTFSMQLRTVESERDEWRTRYSLLSQESVSGAVGSSDGEPPPPYSEKADQTSRTKGLQLVSIPKAKASLLDEVLAELVISVLRPMDAVSRHARVLLRNKFGWIVERLWHLGAAAGYTRVAWTCTCGVQLYGDIKESYSESLQPYINPHNRYNTLAGSSESTEGQQSAGDPQSPDSHLENSNVAMSGQSNSFQKSTGTSNIPGPSEGVTASSSIFEPARAPEPRYLGLCLRAGRFTQVLEELDVSTCISDGALFSKIKLKLKECREATTYRRLSSLLSEINGVAFIKFRSDQFLHVGVIARPSMPPEDKVRERKYVYVPCPMKETPMDSVAFIHYLLAPETDHTEEFFWGLRFPKKLSESFQLRPDIGWGIEILEGPNWALFWTAMTLFTLISGLAAGLFAWLKDDNATGVALGVWLATIQTMILTSVFFRWR